MNKVVIAEGDNALDKILDALEVKKAIKNTEHVFIKPNLRAAGTTNYSRCSITNPQIVKSLVERFLNWGKEVSIGECTSSRHITKWALENSQIKLLEKDSVKVLNLNLYPTKTIKINEGVLKKVEVPLPVANSDFIVSLPVMKTHNQTLVTLCMKNMIGAMSERMPPRIHYAGLHKSIVDINTVIKPSLCIIDATIAMEGSGPVRGGEVVLNTLIGGYDPVSVDSIGATIMGLNPHTIEHIALAEKRGIGKIRASSVIGEIKVRKFKKPGEDGVKFTDLYSFKWFNILMKNTIIHTFAYDYLYYSWKKFRR